MLRGQFCQWVLSPLEIKRESCPYKEQHTCRKRKGGKPRNKEAMCRKGTEWICKKVGWLKPCSDRAFAASEGFMALGVNQEPGRSLGTGGLALHLRGEWSPTSTAAPVRAAVLPGLSFCWCCWFCRGRAGAAIISYLVKTHSFARTSYFQQFTQDCCAVAVCGYSCISSLLLMETELRACFPHGKGQNRGQPACRFTSPYSPTQ